jgi:hypothetical protein
MFFVSSHLRYLEESGFGPKQLLLLLFLVFKLIAESSFIYYKNKTILSKIEIFLFSINSNIVTIILPIVIIMIVLGYP